MNLNDDIRYLKGVGEVKASLLNKIGIYSLNDLINYYPRNYENRDKLRNINQFENEEFTLFVATICSQMQVRYIRKNLSVYSCFAIDENGDTLKLVWFNQKYIRTKVKSGFKYLFYGKTVFDGRLFTVECPAMYNLTDIEKVKGMFPIYPLTYGLTNNYIYKLMCEAFKNDIYTNEIFDEEFRKKYNLIKIDDAIRKVHFPKNEHDISISRRRLIFEELFLLQIALKILKDVNEKTSKQNEFKDIDTKAFEELLPFELTNAQKNTINEIKQDLSSNHVMNRMIQGDVGSGKTMVAAISCFIAVKNGYQAAIMAPTAILATQHYEELKKYFDKLNINVELITSSNTKKQKEEISKKLQDGKIDILIGTHAILEDNIKFKNLALVVTDEQHRFGVNQRVKLINKGNSVETIVMTATPIPRSLAIVLYGDLDISIINEMPKGRLPVKTCVCVPSQQRRVNDFIEGQLKQKRQIYVVCPLVEDSENLDLNSVESVYEIYKNEYFKNYNVAFIHGKMTSKVKDEIMQDFKIGKIDILISTSVIEVGISVPNATLMVVEDADRFGLASLHQLRGRVGRSNIQSYCILKTKNNSAKSKERLKIMEKSNDGFEIAQKDLELRGPGDFFGLRQSGLMEFKIADLINDMEILKLSSEAAKTFDLFDKKNIRVKEKIFNIYNEKINNIGM